MLQENRKLFFFIISSKFIYLLVALLVFSRLTSLGDTDAYLEGQFSDRNNVFSFAYIMSFLGEKLGFFSHIFSLLISCFSIFYLLDRINLSQNDRLLVLFLCFLPSFGVWTSVFTKESFVLFFTCISFGYLIDALKGERLKPTFLQVIVIAAFCTYKPQYALPLMAGILYFFMFKQLKNGYLLVAINVIILIAILLLIPYTLTFTGYLVEEMPKHFSLGAKSTRENDFWLQAVDFYSYLPEGVFVSFVGPTLAESLNNISLLPFFIEGVLLFFIIFYYLIRFIAENREKFNFFIFSVLTIIVFGFFISHYPFGIFNPGSATRYRSGFVFPLIVLLLALTKKQNVLEPST